ncbi:MAG: penicillin-insensitive murein endopeptidase [Archangium sp.]|nr:penicillin-insensitive murein endopeptidase [Archangium sp.]
MARALLLSLLLAAPAWAEADASVPACDAGAADDAGVVLAELAPAVESEAEADDDDGTDGEGDGELEASLDEALPDGGILYSADLSDEELTRRWVEEPESLGSISVGLTEAGRLVNGVQIPPGEAWRVIDANNAWGTQETIDFIVAAANSVRAQFPGAAPLRINHIGKKNGGYLRPHQSHQAGRDVDLGFYYPNDEDPGRLSKKRELAMDLALNWALLKALVTKADVEFVLVDRRIQARLYAFALAQGEDKAWLDRLFHAGQASLIKHARRHRDHFHARFFGGRSQELGRRIQPLLAKQPEQNLVIYRVKKGDTLGGLAVRYNSGVKLIQKANGLTSTSLRVGRTLNIPLRGPCTNCPIPPPLVVPARCLPPEAPPKS